MAIEQNIAEDDHWFSGEDKSLRYFVVDSAGSAQDMTGWALEWVLRSAPNNATATLTKTTGAATVVISNGIGTSDLATVTITDDDTLNLVAKTYHYALRRTDAGSEQVLAFGTAVLQKPTTR